MGAEPSSESEHEGGSLALYGRRDPDGWRYFANVRGTADLAYAARLAFHRAHKKQVYKNYGFEHGAFQTRFSPLDKPQRRNTAINLSKSSSSCRFALNFPRSKALRGSVSGSMTSDPSAVGQEVSFGPERKARAMVDQTRMLLDEDKSDEGEIPKETGYVDAFASRAGSGCIQPA